jgi:ABC-type Fe3+ transport system permease subunit
VPTPLLPSLAAAPIVASIAALLAILVLAALVAYIVRRVTHRARPEDLPQIFMALSHILVALASFLPWTRADNVGCAPPLPTQRAQARSLKEGRLHPVSSGTIMDSARAVLPTEVPSGARRACAVTVISSPAATRVLSLVSGCRRCPSASTHLGTADALNARTRALAPDLPQTANAPSRYSPPTPDRDCPLA